MDVAVRSSATAEDLPDASFAGQQETYLNVRGTTQLLDSCRRCFASLFTDRAISYRTDKGFEHSKIALSIGVQQMVRSDVGASGVMFSIDTESGFRDAVLINAAYGLGENVVQGSVTPDEFYVFKPTLKTGLSPDSEKDVGLERDETDLRRGRQQDDEKRPRARAVTAVVFPLATTTFSNSPAGPASSKTTTPKNAASRRRWTWSGPKTESPASCSSFRPVRKPFSPRNPAISSKPID